MRTYVDYSHYNNESTIDITLKIEDDGSFSYDEWWHSYGSSSGGQASGTWREDNTAFYFRCDYASGQLIFQWFAGGEFKAVKKENSIEFSESFEMSLIHDNPVPEIAEEVNNINPRLAKLYFKDGRVLERKIRNESMQTLYTQPYYKLVDDLGNATYMFQFRQNSENQNSPVVEYDEVNVFLNNESDD